MQYNCPLTMQFQMAMEDCRAEVANSNWIQNFKGIYLQCIANPICNHVYWNVKCTMVIDLLSLPHKFVYLSWLPHLHVLHRCCSLQTGVPVLRNYVAAVTRHHVLDTVLVLQQVDVSEVGKYVVINPDLKDACLPLWQWLWQTKTDLDVPYIIDHDRP